MISFHCVLRVQRSRNRNVDEIKRVVSRHSVHKYALMMTSLNVIRKEKGGRERVSNRTLRDSDVEVSEERRENSKASSRQFVRTLPVSSIDWAGVP